MTAFFFGGVCLGFSAGFFIMALLMSAHKSDEAMELQEFLDHRRAVVEPFISWRVTGQGNIPDTIAIDMNEEGEIYVRTGQFHWEE